MVMSASDGAGRKVSEKHDYFLPLHPGHGLAEYFRPRNLGRALCADICCRTDSHRHASKTGTEKQKRFVHSSLRLVASAPFSWSVCTIRLADTPRQCPLKGGELGNFPSFQHVNNIGHFPKPLGNIGGHRGRHAKRLMNANEILIHREQCNRMRQLNCGNSKEPTTAPT